MDVSTKLELIRGVSEEIITEEELVQLLETKDHPIAYDGFEPSGLAPIHFAIYRAINLQGLLKAGIRFKLWLADYFAFLNNKMQGDLGKIRLVGEYFVEVWKAAGVDMDKVEVLWTSDAIGDRKYWDIVLQVARNTTLKRTFRALTIMGRKEGELQETAQLFYPMMQVADIFYLKADITQLGLDQRRANILARELGPKLGLWKPVVVSHHMLMGLDGPKSLEGYDEDAAIDSAISSKMSKSKPESCIYVHDSKAEIRKKVMSAWCPENVVDGNPILDYAKHIAFKKFPVLKVERSAKYGGPIEFTSYNDLEIAYRSGSLHPLDLKEAVSTYLDLVIAPVREYFEKNKKASELLEQVRRYEITR